MNTQDVTTVQFTWDIQDGNNCGWYAVAKYADGSYAQALEILAHIVAEYDQTYDGEVRGGYWLGAASIPVELMQRAKALVSNQSEDPCR